MAQEDNLSNVTTNTAQILQHAGERTTQTVLMHTEKYSKTFQAINSIVDRFWERLPYLCIAVVVLIIFWLLTKVFKFFIDKTLGNRTHARQNLVLVLNRVCSALILFIGFLIAMVIVIPGFTPGQLVSALGIGSVAVGFAFKDIFQNMLSGILLLLSEPFRIGDDISVSGMEGTVEDIQIRATFLRSFDGRRLVVPNAVLFTSPLIVNTAYSLRRCEFVVGIGYEDDEQKAKQIILDILSNNRHVLSQPAYAVNIVALADFSVNLNVRWWVDTKDISIMSCTSEIQSEVKQAFNAENINIPYPTRELKVQISDDNSANLPSVAAAPSDK